jgi:hypothetical protein
MRMRSPSPGSESMASSLVRCSDGATCRAPWLVDSKGCRPHDWWRALPAWWNANMDRWAVTKLKVTTYIEEKVILLEPYSQQKQNFR